MAAPSHTMGWRYQRPRGVEATLSVAGCMSRGGIALVR
jgi:hypothetical protein